jgi:hypothetical protein
VLRCYREAPTADARHCMFAVLLDHVLGGQVRRRCAASSCSLRPPCQPLPGLLRCSDLMQHQQMARRALEDCSLSAGPASNLSAPAARCSALRSPPHAHTPPPHPPPHTHARAPPHTHTHTHPHPHPHPPSSPHPLSLQRPGGPDAWAPALMQAAHPSEALALGAALLRTGAAEALHPLLLAGMGGGVQPLADAVSTQARRCRLWGRPLLILDPTPPTHPASLPPPFSYPLQLCLPPRRPTPPPPFSPCHLKCQYLKLRRWLRKLPRCGPV